MQHPRSLFLAGFMFALMFPGLGPSHIRAQDRGGVGRRSDASQMASRGGRYVFAGIGINAYTNPTAWPVLDNAVNDVDSLRVMLTEEFGFTSPDGWVLRDEDATRQGIMSLVQDQLPEELESTDNVVLFFAGHGYTETRRGVETGYIIPRDAKDSRSQWIKIEDLLEEVALLDVDHILVILDSCFGGMALTGWAKSGESDGGQKGSGGTSRRVLTSAQANEKAADGGVRFPGNSLFTGWLVEGLRQGIADGLGTPNINADEFLTSRELFLFLEDRVGGAEGSTQTPAFGRFAVDQGELALWLDSDPFGQLYRMAVNMYEQNDGSEEFEVEDFELLVEDALSVQEEGPRPAFLRYRLASSQGKDAEALAALRELEELSASGVEIPMLMNDLTIQLGFMERLCGKGRCSASGGEQ